MEKQPPWGAFWGTRCPYPLTSADAARFIDNLTDEYQTLWDMIAPWISSKLRSKGIADWEDMTQDIALWGWLHIEEMRRGDGEWNERRLFGWLWSVGFRMVQRQRYSHTVSESDLARAGDEPFPDMIDTRTIKVDHYIPLSYTSPGDMYDHRMVAMIAHLNLIPPESSWTPDVYVPTDGGLSFLSRIADDVDARRLSVKVSTRLAALCLLGDREWPAITLQRAHARWVLRMVAKAMLDTNDGDYRGFPARLARELNVHERTINNNVGHIKEMILVLSEGA